MNIVLVMEDEIMFRFINYISDFKGNFSVHNFCRLYMKNIIKILKNKIIDCLII